MSPLVPFLIFLLVLPAFASSVYKKQSLDNLILALTSFYSSPTLEVSLPGSKLLPTEQTFRMLGAINLTILMHLKAYADFSKKNKSFIDGVDFETYKKCLWQVCFPGSALHEKAFGVLNSRIIQVIAKPWTLLTNDQPLFSYIDSQNYIRTKTLKTTSSTRGVFLFGEIPLGEVPVGFSPPLLHIFDVIPNYNRELLAFLTEDILMVCPEKGFLVNKRAKIKLYRILKLRLSIFQTALPGKFRTNDIDRQIRAGFIPRLNDYHYDADVMSPDLYLTMMRTIICSSVQSIPSQKQSFDIPHFRYHLHGILNALFPGCTIHLEDSTIQREPPFLIMEGNRVTGLVLLCTRNENIGKFTTLILEVSNVPTPRSIFSYIVTELALFPNLNTRPLTPLSDIQTQIYDACSMVKRVRNYPSLEELESLKMTLLSAYAMTNHQTDENIFIVPNVLNARDNFQVVARVLEYSPSTRLLVPINVPVKPNSWIAFNGKHIYSNLLSPALLLRLASGETLVITMKHNDEPEISTIVQVRALTHNDSE